MKNALLIIITLTTGKLIAQPADLSARCKEEMKKLEFFAGDWKGEALYRGKKIVQSEHIVWQLDGLLLSIEGTGREKNVATGKEDITFHAFGVINYDPNENQFKFKSFVKEGHSANAYFTILSPNHFEWGFETAGNGKVRYTITLNPEKKSWNEIGEFSRDGNTWMKTIELNLNKL